MAKIRKFILTFSTSSSASTSNLTSPVSLKKNELMFRIEHQLTASKRFFPQLNSKKVSS